MRHAHGLILTCDGTVERALTPLLLYFGLADGRAARGETCMHRACRIGRGAMRIRSVFVNSPSRSLAPRLPSISRHSTPPRLVWFHSAVPRGPSPRACNKKNPACLGQPCSSQEARQAFLRRFDIFGGISLSLPEHLPALSVLEVCSPNPAIAGRRLDPSCCLDTTRLRGSVA